MFQASVPVTADWPSHFPPTQEETKFATDTINTGDWRPRGPANDGPWRLYGRSVGFFVFVLFLPVLGLWHQHSQQAVCLGSLGIMITRWFLARGWAIRTVERGDDGDEETGWLAV
jgi:hypothetical protein